MTTLFIRPIDPVLTWIISASRPFTDYAGLPLWHVFATVGRNHMRDDDEEEGYKIKKPPMSQRERERLQRQHVSWLKFIAKSAAVGAALGVIATWAFLESNINGFGEMIARSPNRIGFTALLTLSFASTCAAIAMGIGIMIRSDHPDKFDEE